MSVIAPPKRAKQHRVENEVEEKHCHVCNEWKTLVEYHKDSTKWDKLDIKCKACKKAYGQENRERILARSKVWRDTHKEEKKRRALNTE